MARQLKKDVYDILEKGATTHPVAKHLNKFIVALILLNVGLAVMETEPWFGKGWPTLLIALDMGAGLIFLVEYVLRLWIADLHPPLRRYQPWRARLQYAIQPLAIIDLLAVLPFILAVLTDYVTWKAFVILRLLRFMKIARYSPAMRSLASAVVTERKAIMASLVIIFGTILIAATTMYLVEHQAQPEKLGTIPDAMWWAFATLTTVGYGDVVPITWAGKVVASIVMLTGYCLFALPVGIIGTAFVREINSRDFVVSWSMVAEVPMFEDLSAIEIKEVAHLLKSQSAVDNEEIVRRGERADALYLITSGAVVAITPDGQTRLEQGQYFGEMVPHGDAERTASVYATEPSQFLVLRLEDLRDLMRRTPELATKVAHRAFEATKSGMSAAGPDA
ncbi:cyclic nucleotide-gated ion channel [Pseudovibrio sp. SPO723]|nr:cyclic nucleotide-gated ion channel [Pseudovibrio sp. SPO723]MDX5594175.1 cyclic nucleotide-gated ion channel [Pseudovibrio sp. SPO723]